MASNLKNKIKNKTLQKFSNDQSVFLKAWIEKNKNPATLQCFHGRRHKVRSQTFPGKWSNADSKLLLFNLSVIPSTL